MPTKEIYLCSFVQKIKYKILRYKTNYIFCFKCVKLIHLCVISKTLKILIHRHHYLDTYTIKVLFIIHFLNGRKIICYYKKCYHSFFISLYINLIALITVIILACANKFYWHTQQHLKRQIEIYQLFLSLMISFNGTCSFFVSRSLTYILKCLEFSNKYHLVFLICCKLFS